MTIAYDLRYSADHFGGIGTHAHALLEALLEQPGDERYLVLWDPRLHQTRFDLGSIARHPRVEWSEARLAPLSARGLLGLGAWLRSRRPDVYFSPYHLWPPGAGCPTVLMIHDVHPLRLKGELGWRGRLFYRLSLALARQATAIVTCSEFSRREIAALTGIPAARVHVAFQGVPPRSRPSDVSAPDGLPPGPYALVVGDNRPRKNLETLARVWQRLGAAPPLTLVWAGRPMPRHEGLVEMSRRLGATGVVGTGWVDPGRLQWLYEHSTLVLLPTRYEGFGFPLLEAFARGAPVIASDIPPLREIGDGVARFVAPDDVAGWASMVSALADDAPERERMRAAGRARAAELTYAKTAAATLSVLREVMRGTTRDRTPGGRLA